MFLQRLFQDNKIKVNRRALRVAEYTLRVPDPANKPERPVRIALLADLHDSVAGRSERELPDLVDRYAPDLVICAGDMLTAKAGMNRMGRAMRLLRSLCGRYPAFLSDGNHESRLRRHPEVYPGRYRDYVMSLADMGAVLLNNRTRIVKVAGMRIAIHGFVQDLRHYNRAHPGVITSRDLYDALGSPDECGAHTYHLLIAHMPDPFKAYSAWGADLTVSGHIHGGIVRLPLLGGLFGSTFRPFPKYDRGLFTAKTADATGDRVTEHHMIVSAGLGSHTLAIRVNNPPELVMITLT